ncbi:MAG TPA: hypothetical protein VMU25_01545 [Candidatus Paceibacterota bacterium]|nr:hypothetical protein [Candidatus Paceibacterota bacterium]
MYTPTVRSRSDILKPKRRREVNSDNKDFDKNQRQQNQDERSQGQQGQMQPSKGSRPQDQTKRQANQSQVGKSK